MSDFQYFLAVSGVFGTASANGMDGLFALSSWNLSASQAASPLPGSPSPSADFGPLEVTVNDSAALAIIMSRIGTGTSAPAATLYAYSPGATPTEAYRLDLGSVYVSNVNQAGGGYQLSLVYKTFELQFVPPPSGGTAPSFGWETTTSTPTTVASVGTQQTVATITPSRYFLLVNGIDGGSIDPAHQRWFEVTAFDIDLENVLTVGSAGNTAADGQYRPLHVSFGDDSAITDFLLKAANGARIAGVRLEGVTLGANPTAVYDLTLSDIVVQNVSDTSGDGFSVDLDYRKIELVQKGVNSSGTLVMTGQFGWDRLTATSYTPAATLPPLIPGSAPGDGVYGGPLEYSLVVDGVKGASQRAYATGALAVSNYSFGVDQTGTAVEGGPGGAGKSIFGALSIHFDDDTSLSAFLDKIAKGASFTTASLTAWNPASSGTNAKIVYQIKLGDAFVTKVIDDTSGYTVDFIYKTIGVSTWSAASTGVAGSPDSTFGWNVATKTAFTPSSGLVTGTAVAATTPSRYFLFVQGVDGGSVAPGHERWFELESASFEVSADTSVSSGAGGASVGKAEFGLLNVKFADDTGLTKLLLSAAKGSVIGTVRVEGVTDGEAPTTVYYATLSSAIVANVGDRGGDGYSAQFDFRKIELIERGQKPDGTYEVTSGVSVDRVANTVTTPAGTPAPVTPASAPGDGVRDDEALSYFLNVDGIAGDSVVAARRGAFTVESFDFEVTQSARYRASNGAPTGVSDFGALTVRIVNQTALADFQKKFFDGSMIGAMTLTARTSGRGAYDAYRLTLANASITNIAVNGDGYILTIDYDKIALEERSVTSTGTSAFYGKFGWDKVAKTETTLTPVANTTQVASIAPDRFYLLVEGVDGGSTEKDHRGWFEMSSWAVDGSDPLEVTFGNVTGLAALLAKATTGDHVRAMRIEGVKVLTLGSGAEVLTPIYDISLADVVVKRVDTLGGGYSASFQYAGIEYLTRAKGSDGFYEATGRTGFDNTTGSIYAPSGFTSVQLSENEVGNGSSTQSGTQPNQTGGALGVRLQSTDDNGFGVGPVTYASDEGFSYSAAPGDFLEIRDLPSYTRVQLVASMQLGTSGNDTLVTTDARGAYLNGGKGNDTLTGGNGFDVLYGGEGNDTLNGGNGDYDALYGGAGDDTLNGGAGYDGMYGGEGSDIYYTDGLDTIRDTGTTGTDLLYTSVSFTLGADMGIENLTALGTLVNGSLRGNDLANRISGNSSNDTISGFGGDDVLLGNVGNDRLTGGAGKDTLTGGAGFDTFAMSSSDSPASTSMLGFDTITDFTSGTDFIDLDEYEGSPSIHYAEAAITTKTYGAAYSAASTLLAGGADVAFIANGSDGYLFWNSDANVGTPDGAVKLAKAGTLSAFAATDVG